MPDRADEFTEKETAERRDEVLKRMLNTPPRPHVARPTRPAKGPKKAGAARTSGRRKSDPAS